MKIEIKVCEGKEYRNKKIHKNTNPLNTGIISRRINCRLICRPILAGILPLLGNSNITRDLINAFDKFHSQPFTDMPRDMTVHQLDVNSIPYKPYPYSWIVEGKRDDNKTSCRGAETWRW